MTVTKKWIISGVLAVSLLSAGVPLTQGTPSVDWWVVGGGGGSATVDGVSLNGTIGQWMVGSGEAGATQLNSGFWSRGAIKSLKVYLPLVVRDQ